MTTKKPTASKATASATKAKSRAPRPSQNDAGNVADDDISQRRDIKLGYLFHDVSRLRRTAFDVIVKPLGVTRAQWWVIAHLSRHDGMFQKQLADLLDVGKASLGALLDRLEATGFIVRRPEPSDRRIKRVFLTKNSLQLLEQLRAAESDFNARIFAGISDKERKELFHLLTTIREALSTMDLGVGSNVK